ncbi:MAG: PSD1 domain-containing protein [Planctomycetaceae bacterium]|nr:PSD1 domain-containing protein [Planctomycetaceae bacterium]
MNCITHAKSTLSFVLMTALSSIAFADDVVDFNRDVRPILADHCLHCHGPDPTQRQANLRLDLPEGVYDERDGHRVIDRESPHNSELLRRINSRDDETRMPPPEAARQLTAAEILTLQRWIESGANWNTHWSFVPPQPPTVPQVQDDTWPRNGIDNFILARLQREMLSPAEAADRYVLIRRVTLALTGLPPTIEEVDAFVSDQSEDAYERVVDRLMNSPAYGEHMALGWLEAARYADSAGYQADWERFMWPWRDWVVQALNENMPFDQFTIEQIAGDMLPNPTMSQRLATGFNRNHRINDEGGSLDAEFEVEYVIDRVDTTSTVWLGISAGCARCHDHKYDPLSQREFYQLYAYFNNVPEKGIDGRKGAAVPFIDVPNPKVQQQCEELAAELEQAKRNRPNEAEEIKSMAEKLEKLRTKVTTPVMVMQEQLEREPAFILKRGAYDQPDTSEAIPPGLPQVFLTETEKSPEDRLGFAQWLVSNDNPLTARVIVNRIWQHHFGTGLVKTSEDFGTRGDPPSHPELLDWLATEFVRLGWDLKAMHRLIVTSATFQQSSHVSDSLRAIDPYNRLLARGPRLRLSGAAIRDQALATSGLLVRTMGGPPVKPYQPEGLWKELSFGTGKTSIDFYVQDHGESLWRRGLYTFWKRTVAPPQLAAFDGGSRDMCRVRSDRTNTPLQALTLQNDITFVEAARHLAERMMLAAEDSSEDGLRLAWRLVLVRPPAPDELQILKRALERYQAVFRSAPDEAAKLLDYGESARDARLDVADHAAWTMVALSILNLDEAITQE